MKIYSLLIVLLLLASCSSHQDSSLYHGILSARSENDTLPDFTYLLKSQSRDFSQQFSTLSALNGLELEIGDYTLEAFNGNPDSQGHGEEYFYGIENFTILADQLTQVNVHTSRQKAHVTLEFSQAFQGYMQQYQARVNDIEYSISDTRPFCVLPSEVTVKVNYTLPQGEEGQLEAARFQAEKNKNYHITIDLNEGQMGNSLFDITFDETLITENIDIFPQN